MNNTQQSIEVCNKLLRGEMSAVETYEQAISKFKDSRDSEILVELCAEHRDSVEELCEQISAMGGVPDSDSGPWGTFAQAVEAGAKLLGGSAALTALIEGEQHGVNEYEEALNDPDMMGGAKESIRDLLLPRLYDHIAALETLRAA
jgi:uncharacterized protein (TIGR02284 family)